jgi:hypothetical protein
MSPRLIYRSGFGVYWINARPRATPALQALPAGTPPSLQESCPSYCGCRDYPNRAINGPEQLQQDAGVTYIT